MSFFSLLAVFILEQAWPLSYRRWVRTPFHTLARFVSNRFDAGTYVNGVAATLSILVPALLLALVLYFVLLSINPFLAWGMNVLVLYFTMGFRQFSHHFTQILTALRDHNLPLARRCLADWRHENGLPIDENGSLKESSEIARESMVMALLAVHRHVFAVLLWFVLLPGPVGALLYRLCALLSEAWAPSDTDPEPFSAFPNRLFSYLDWLPTRATVAIFAIVGNFEDAVYSAGQGRLYDRDPNKGIILGGAAGALGVRLSDRPEPDLADPALVDLTPESDEIVLTNTVEAGPDTMQSAVGLVWRATVLWVILLCLLGVSSLLG